MTWRGKVCLITGASSGFGYEAAKLLAAKGAHLIVVARRTDRLRSVVEELGGAPHRYVTADVSNVEGVRQLAADVSQMTSHLDVLVNNAGVRTSGPLAGTTSEDVGRVLATNLMGPIWCTVEMLPLLRAASKTKRTPIIVNVASIAGRLAIPRSADYVASKFGLVGFTESSWLELRKIGIRTMMLNPGLADTEGFPMDDLRASPITSWAVMDASRVARAMVRGVEMGRFEVRVQWWLHPLYHLSVWMGPLRRSAASLARQVLGGKGRF